MDPSHTPEAGAVPAAAGGGRSPAVAAGVRARAARHWPVLLAATATLGYAVAILGFGLVYRPLNNDEGVTLQVAQRASVVDVLDVALTERHGPPLHYVLVHASLAVRPDMLGLRLPSALLGIAAVALTFGMARELAGARIAALASVLVAISPITVHLGQFSRGYTALIAATALSLWLALVLTRTRRLRWVPAYALAALLVVSAHPFGLFALASELAVLAALGLWPLLRSPGQRRRGGVVVGVALVAGLAALVALRAVYAPLGDKYGVGAGGSVVDPLSAGFWDRLGSAAAGTSVPVVPVALALLVLAGLVLLAREDPRAAFACAVLLVLPLVMLTVLTASSDDFAAERHLSFLLPPFAVCVAAGLVWVARIVGGGLRGAVVAAVVFALVAVPAAAADYRDIGTFRGDLRDAGLYLESRFRPDDVLLTTAGRNLAGVDSRLYGLYATLVAHDGSPLADWHHVGSATWCDLISGLRQRPHPERAWVLLRPRDPEAALARVAAVPGASPRRFGDFIVTSVPVRDRTVAGALRAGLAVYRTLADERVGSGDIVRTANRYRITARMAEGGVCP